MPLPIHVWLVRPAAKTCDAFANRFDGLPNVRVIQSRFEDLDGTLRLPGGVRSPMTAKRKWSSDWP